jgi:hypothetical protein
MRWSVALSLLASLAVSATGCRSCDKVESELRAREQDVRTLRSEMGRLENTNHALQRELAAMHGLPGPHGVVEKPSEPYPVRSLVVGRQTAGRPSETCPGDDGLIVLIEPRDCDNQAIKAPGALTVAAWELPDEGAKRLLAVWEITPDQLRRSWQNGLFTTGYRLNLAFHAWPSAEKLRVAARFRMINGRIFEGDRDITIRLAPPGRRPPLSAPAPTPTPPSTLPPPTPDKPSTPDKPPTQMLPPPTPETEKKEPPPPDPPPSSLPSGDPEGPILMRGQVKPPAAQILRPISLAPEGE